MRRKRMAQHLAPGQLIAWLLLLGVSTTINTKAVGGDQWVIDTQAQWKQSKSTQNGLKITDGMAAPTEKTAILVSVLKSFPTKRTASSIELQQSPEWLNWEPIENIGPVNLGDAPVMLSLGPSNYGMFGRYGG